MYLDPNKFEYEIKVDEEIEPEYAMIPSLILQPFVENAIIHGLQNKTSKGKLLVDIKEKDDAILCIIEDDGIGREAAMKLKKMRQPHKSVGLSLTQDRLKIVNQVDTVSVNFIDLLNEIGNAAGTRVEILINQ